MKSHWLISMKVQPVYFYPDGSARRSEPFETVCAIDQEPARYLLETKQNLNRMFSKEIELDKSGPPPRADDILAVYWTTEIPRSFSRNEIDQLS